MKSYIYVQMIILLVFNFEFIYSMEADTDETASTPTSQVVTEEICEQEQHGNSDLDERSAASTISSTTEVADFSRDIITTNRIIFANILEKECNRKIDQDLIERAIDLGLEFYDKDRGRYSILLNIPKTKEARQTQRACLNQLVEQINTKLQQQNNRSTPRQEPMRHPSDVKKTHIKRNVVIASLFCGVGICCLATGGLLVAAIWQSMEHFNN